MKARKYIEEWSNGKYHYSSKDVEDLLNHDMLEVFNARYYVVIRVNKKNADGYRYIRMSKTITGKNKNSWRLIGVYQWLFDEYKERGWIL